MRNISEGALEVIIAVIIFIIILLAYFRLMGVFTSDGRISAKIAYALAAIPSFMVDPVASASDQVSKWSLIIAGITLGVVAGLSMAGVDLGGEDDVGESPQAASSLKATIEDQATGIVGSLKKIGQNLVENFPDNLWASRWVLVPTAAVGAGSFLLAYGLNGLAQSIQEPIIDNLVKPEVIIYNYNDPSATNIQNRMRINPDLYNDKEVALAFMITKYTYFTYAESLGVRIPFMHLHYVLITNVTDDIKINYLDILCVMNDSYTGQYSWLEKVGGQVGALQGANINSYEVCDALGIDPNNLLSSNKPALFGATLIEKKSGETLKNRIGWIIYGPGVYIIEFIYDGYGVEIVSLKG